MKVTALCAILLSLLCMAHVSAIGVSGAKYMGSISPGGMDTHVVTVDVGATESGTDMMIEVAGFGQTPDGTYIPLEPGKDANPYSARSLITLNQSKFHLNPGMKQSIAATITLPQNAGPGGRYAIIYVRSLPRADSSMATAVVVPVFITVSNTTPTMTGSITGISVGEVTQGQPIIVTTMLKNTGNYHYYHTVNNVAISDASGKAIGSFTTQPLISAIIPGNTVNYTVTPKLTDLPVGTYTVDSKVLLESGTVLDEKTTTFSIKTKYIPPVTESNITLTPGNAGTLTSPDGRYSVSFPQGAVLSDVVVTLKSDSKDKLHPAPSGAKLGATSFEVAGLAGLLSKDATVKVTYSADDLAAAGGDASQLKLAYYDATKNAWVILHTQADTGSKTLTATTNRMGVWAVMVSSSPSAGSSAGSFWGISLPALPLSPVLSIIAIAAAAIIVIGTVRKRK
jgi:hypothetical protein